MADRIAAGTYMIAAAITGGDVAVTGISPEYLRSLINKLSECGCEVECASERIRVSAPWRLKSPRIIETMPLSWFSYRFAGPDDGFADGVRRNLHHCGEYF